MRSIFCLIACKLISQRPLPFSYRSTTPVFLASPVVKISETFEAINVMSVLRQSGMPSGGSDCVSNTHRFAVFCIFLFKQRHM